MLNELEQLWKKEMEENQKDIESSCSEKRKMFLLFKHQDELNTVNHNSYSVFLLSLHSLAWVTHSLQ